MSKKRIKAPDLGPCEFIKVYYDSELREYSALAQRTGAEGDRSGAA